MSYVTHPPSYDVRRQPNGEPPGYLDTSRDRDLGFVRDDRGYPLDEHGYPVDDREHGYSFDDRGGDGYAVASRGYGGDRDFRPMDQPGYHREYSELDRGYVRMVVFVKVVGAIKRIRSGLVFYATFLSLLDGPPERRQL